MTEPITIMAVSQKGGVGKSTISEELAFSLDRSGIPFAFYDLDGQGGSLHAGRKDPDPRAVIVDTPAGLDDRTLSMLADVDLAVVAVNASGRDMAPMRRTLDAIDAAGVPFAVVVTRCNRYNVTRDFVDWLSRQVGSGNVILLPQAEAFPQAYLAGKSVVDYQRSGKAAEAVIYMANAIRKRAGLPVEEMKVLRRKDADAPAPAPAKVLADNSRKG